MSSGLRFTWSDKTVGPCPRSSPTMPLRQEQCLAALLPGRRRVPGFLQQTLGRVQLTASRQPLCFPDNSAGLPALRRSYSAKARSASVGRPQA